MNSARSPKSIRIWSNTSYENFSAGGMGRGEGGRASVQNGSASFHVFPLRYIPKIWRMGEEVVRRMLFSMHGHGHGHGHDGYDEDRSAARQMASFYSLRKWTICYFWTVIRPILPTIPLSPGSILQSVVHEITTSDQREWLLTRVLCAWWCWSD